MLTSYASVLAFWLWLSASPTARPVHSWERGPTCGACSLSRPRLQVSVPSLISHYQGPSVITAVVAFPASIKLAAASGALILNYRSFKHLANRRVAVYAQFLDVQRQLPSALAASSPVKHVSLSFQVPLSRLVCPPTAAARTSNAADEVKSTVRNSSSNPRHSSSSGSSKHPIDRSWASISSDQRCMAQV